MTTTVVPLAGLIAQALETDRACPACKQQGLPHKGFLLCANRTCPAYGVILRPLRADER